MGSRQPERQIPHVRDIFKLTSSEEFDGHRSGANKYDGRMQVSPRRAVEADHSVDEEHQGSRSNFHHYKDYGRTLTEKDLKHIERHLSMKKTIRKQLSRHLTQAFVDTDDSAGETLRHEEQPCAATGDRSRVDIRNKLSSDACFQNSYNLTFTRSNVAKSEANFLDLLKEIRDDDGDGSGHCIPMCDPDVLQSEWHKKSNNHNNNINNNNYSLKNVAATNELGNLQQDTKKSSFWKKLTIRAKSKR